VVCGTARRRRGLCSPRRSSNGAGGEQGGSGSARKALGGRPFYRRSSPCQGPHGERLGAYGLSTASHAEHAAAQPPRWLGARNLGARGLVLRASLGKVRCAGERVLEQCNCPRSAGRHPDAEAARRGAARRGAARCYSFSLGHFEHDFLPKIE
jgi:hypothetical protein